MEQREETEFGYRASVTGFIIFMVLSLLLGTLTLLTRNLLIFKLLCFCVIDGTINWILAWLLSGGHARVGKSIPFVLVKLVVFTISTPFVIMLSYVSKLYIKMLED